MNINYVIFIYYVDIRNSKSAAQERMLKTVVLNSAAIGKLYIKLLGKNEMVLKN